MFKRFILLLALAVGCMFGSAHADQYVKGHYRNGKWIDGHYRSTPNKTVTDNFSFYGNTNPYTGSVGTNRYYNSTSSPYYRGYTSPSYGSYGSSGDYYKSTSRTYRSKRHGYYTYPKKR